MDNHTITPQSSEPTLAPGDSRALLAGAAATACNVMDGVTPDQWDLPTACDGMCVGQLLEHLVMVMRRVERAGRFVPTAEWPMDAADVPAGGWCDAFIAASHEAQTAWTSDRLAEPRELPWGLFPGDAVLGVYTNELTVHTWDLAQATGQEVVWNQDVLETSWDAIHQQLPIAKREEIWAAVKASLAPDYPWEDPFGDAVPIADDAPLISRLVAWNGRSVPPAS